MGNFEILAEGLQFPEGPIAMPDGSVILVEIKRGALTRVWNGKNEVIAEIGGGPNGAALGPDGAVYVTNNGGFAWHEAGGFTIPGDAAPDYTTGRIERVDLSTGKVERLYESVNGNPLSGPNDLVFDAAGGFWFTDLGKNYRRSTDRGGLYYAKPNGTLLKEAAYGYVGLNGVGLAPDGKSVYAAETETARLWAFDITGEGEVGAGAFGLSGRVVCTQQAHVYFDSLALQANGDVCVATLGQGGITTITPAGVSTHTPFPDFLVTNIAFGGADMRDAFITLSSSGKLIKARWPEPGLRLNFNPY
ncbi:MAG: SMP-30/gluconolactonase/LRE family protein [Hyphomonadaceae bacterium]|nr:SMP-30/gluconolactonase/LRE family protein [Hyphomonadaceae bacterium]MBX3510816.1 SMP-30/gluconolactonase/LRE family protein [Hyphomonadaceae bacterium]